jgi:ABC-type lipoprotein release transport system permease subunit
VGKRYSVLAAGGEQALPGVRAIPGVEAAAVRYEVDAADAFRLGEGVRLVAYPGDHTRFEAPPLAAGRRVRSAGEAEVGAGLADAQGLRPGSTVAALLDGTREVRFRVVGVVRALERDGRIAYVRPDRLLAADHDIRSAIAVRLAPGADRGLVERRLRALGAAPRDVGGATTSNGRFLGVLAAVLRGVGLAVGLVCLYALVQALAMTARERRGAVAVLRASGAGSVPVALVLSGAALAVALPGALGGVLLGSEVLGPLVGRLAAGFADLAVTPSAAQAAAVVAGLLGLAGAATALVARRIVREPIVAGLRED